MTGRGRSPPWSKIMHVDIRREEADLAACPCAPSFPFSFAPLQQEDISLMWAHGRPHAVTPRAAAPRDPRSGGRLYLSPGEGLGGGVSRRWDISWDVTRLVSRGPAFSKMPRAWLLDCFALRQMENGETEGAFMTSGSVSATPACATAGPEVIMSGRWTPKLPKPR